MVDLLKKHKDQLKVIFLENRELLKFIYFTSDPLKEDNLKNPYILFNEKVISFGVDKKSSPKKASKVIIETHYNELENKNIKIDYVFNIYVDAEFNDLGIQREERLDFIVAEISKGLKGKEEFSKGKLEYHSPIDFYENDKIIQAKLICHLDL